MPSPDPPTRPLDFVRRRPDEMMVRARFFREAMASRRSVRAFSRDPIPHGVLEECVRAAGQAPSGANKQPWRFVAVTEPSLKRQIREAAEVEERELYERRASPRWLADLAPLGTDAVKPFLEEAPALVVVFMDKRGSYYAAESVGIAVGFFLAACALAGIATLTHTPSPMGFLGEILGRPSHERPYLLIPVGYPAPGCRVPDLERKPLESILDWR